MIYRTFRVQADLSEYGMANFLWDGLNHILASEAISELLAGAHLTQSLADRAIREAFVRNGEDSVSCGPIHDQTARQGEWCLEQIRRIYG